MAYDDDNEEEDPLDAYMKLLDLNKLTTRFTVRGSVSILWMDTQMGA